MLFGVFPGGEIRCRSTGTWEEGQTGEEDGGQKREEDRDIVGG